MTDGYDWADGEQDDVPTSRPSDDPLLPEQGSAEAEDLYRRGLYIKVHPTEKRPLEAYTRDGEQDWPPDPDNPNVYDFEEMSEWVGREARAGLVGVEGPYMLGVLDLDLYKQDEWDHTDLASHRDPDEWHWVKSLGDDRPKEDFGLHLPFLVPESAAREQWAPESAWEYADLKGSLACGYVVCHVGADGYEPAREDWRERRVPVMRDADGFLSLGAGGDDVVGAGGSFTPPSEKAPEGGWDEYDPDYGFTVHAVVGERLDEGRGRRMPHPFHESDTRKNFMVDEGGATCRCWRHDETISALGLLAMREGIAGGCGDAASLTPEQRTEAWDVAVGEGLVEERGSLGPDSTRLLPEWEPMREADDRADAARLRRATRAVEDEFRTPFEGAKVVEAPQGLGKTVNAAIGARTEPRLVITRNKDEHRDTLKWAADEAGVRWREVIPFAESWLMSGESPVADECRELYEAGVAPRLITERHADEIPEHAPTPYLDQFESEITAELLLGSPGHENVGRFAEHPEGPRTIVYDDVDPADHAIGESRVHLGEDRAELDEACRAIGELDGDTLEAVTSSSDDLGTVGALAPSGTGDGGDGDDEPTDVWHALEEAADETEAIRVDLPSLVLDHGLPGDILTKLKVACGREPRGIRSWPAGDGAIRWVEHPDLRDNAAVVASATPAPGLPERWLEETGVGEAEREAVCDDWAAVRRAQGYTVVQTSEYRHSRHGESRPERATALADAVGEREGERPKVVDSLGMLREHGEEGVNFARTWSNNELREERVGLVMGCTYFGDEWIEARAGYLGEPAEIAHPDGERASASTPEASRLMRHMLRAPVEQAITRFGRDGGGCVVYVDTDEIPGGFPVVDASAEVREVTPSLAAAYSAIRDGPATAAGIADAAGVSDRQGRNLAARLVEEGLASVEEFAGDEGAHEYEGEGDLGLSGSSVIGLNKARLPRASRERRYDGRSAGSGDDDDGPIAEQLEITDLVDPGG